MSQPEDVEEDRSAAPRGLRGLLRQDKLDAMVEDRFADITNFVEMYGGPDSPLSPRLAWGIWTTAVRLADEYQDEDAWHLLRDELPRLAQDAADSAWMARFVLGFDAIAARLTQGRRDLSRIASCTGDEMALHLVIDEAECSLAEGLLSAPDLLPEDAERDDDFEWARDVLFRDHDVLLLFDPALDGVDDPASELDQRFRFANLHPGRWFLPFADHVEVDGSEK